MIKRELINNNIFTEEQLDKIHDATMEILKENGIEILSEKARVIFSKNGAKIEGKQVFISESMVEDALKSVPKKFTICINAVDKCFGGFDSTFPGTPLNPSYKSSFNDHPAQYPAIPMDKS